MTRVFLLPFMLLALSSGLSLVVARPVGARVPSLLPGAEGDEMVGFDPTATDVTFPGQIIMDYVSIKNAAARNATLQRWHGGRVLPAHVAYQQYQVDDLP